MKYLVIFLALLMLIILGCINDPVKRAMDNPTTTKTALVRNNCQNKVNYSVQYNDGYNQHSFSHDEGVHLDFHNIENRELAPGQEDIFVWSGSVFLSHITSLYSSDTLKLLLNYIMEKNIHMMNQHFLIVKVFLMI